MIWILQKYFCSLTKIINNGVRPKFISFETDLYQEKIDYSLLAYNFLKPYGYKIAVSDVYSSLKKIKFLKLGLWLAQLILKVLVTQNG